MRIRELETFTRARGSGTNLDRFVVTEGWAAVFDGATPKAADMVAATAATSRLVDDLVEVVRTAPAELDPYELVVRLSEAAPAPAPGGPAASGAIFSPATSTVLVISDTWVSLDGLAVYYGHRYEELMTGVRRALTEAAVADGSSIEELRREDPGRQAIVDVIRAEVTLRNVDEQGDFFYAAIDGNPIPRRLLTEVRVPAGTRTLCLATDGYPELRSTLAETEQALAAALAADPLRIGAHGGTKAVAPGADSYDDRTFVHLGLEG